MQDLLGIAIRISVIYLYTLAILRLSGKRSIGNLTPLDFVVATIIGDMFDDMIWAEVPLSQGLVGLTTIVLWHILVAFATYKSIWLHNLVASTKTSVLRSGRLIKKEMQKERTPKVEILSQLRLQGEDKQKEVREASWEPSGQLSVIKEEWAETAQKKDKPRLEELFR